ncbi:MAG: hypothetical protein ACRCXM_00990 [Beijerinckiaceae bacterium]
MNRAILILAWAVTTTPAVVTAAHAQSRAMAPKNAASVVVTNGRATPLQQLNIVTADANATVVARLRKPLAPGKSITLPNKAKSGCLFDVRSSYEDGADPGAEGLDLCADKNVRLTDE